MLVPRPLTVVNSPVGRTSDGPARRWPVPRERLRLVEGWHSSRRGVLLAHKLYIPTDKTIVGCIGMCHGYGTAPPSLPRRMCVMCGLQATTRRTCTWTSR